jgi:hypothetical protein
VHSHQPRTFERFDLYHLVIAFQIDVALGKLQLTTDDCRMLEGSDVLLLLLPDAWGILPVTQEITPIETVRWS